MLGWAEPNLARVEEDEPIPMPVSTALREPMVAGLKTGEPSLEGPGEPSLESLGEAMRFRDLTEDVRTRRLRSRSRSRFLFFLVGS